MCGPVVTQLDTQPPDLSPGHPGDLPPGEGVPFRVKADADDRTLPPCGVACGLTWLFMLSGVGT